MTQLPLEFRAPSAASEPSTGGLDKTLLVEAGAGTGKTFALVERVVALVRAGVPIERIVAITFTERAAAELRERIRAGLEQAKGEDGDTSVIDVALRALDRAQVSTIHAFAQAQLRAFAAEAGIDPDFRILDEVQGQRRLQERRREFLEALGEHQEAIAAIDRALTLGLRPSDINALIDGLYYKPDVEPLLASLIEPEPEWPDVNSMADELADWARDGPPDDGLTKVVVEMANLVGRIIAAPHQRDALVARHAKLLSKTYGRTGRKDFWTTIEDIEVVRSTLGDLSQGLGEALSAVRTQALTKLLKHVARFIRDDAGTRGREGLLTFDDLIIKLRDLLRESPGAAEALRERYSVLLIDEFQDTDPIQVDIALSFATDPATGKIEPGRLYLVGDPKQSIYRFRRADMGIYAQTRRLVEEAGGELPELQRNRRSRRIIIDWVNDVFAKLIGTGANPDVQPPYARITPVRENMDLRGPGVAWLGSEVAGAAAEMRRQEAKSIAVTCRQIILDGWQVEEHGAKREARYGDIAILMPTRGILSGLERSLGDIRVPYRVESGSLIYRTQEVRDLINALTAIDDPSDEVAIAAALRSPAFACSDLDLARHKAAGGRWNFLSPDADGWEGPVGEALRGLRAYHMLRLEHSLSALVERFVGERGFAEIGVLDQDSRNSFRRMRFVVEQARRFESLGPESLRSFVTWLERQATGPVFDQEGSSLDDDEDAVRILTVHAAKGLEFKIVIVAGLGTGTSGQGEMYLADFANEKVGVAAGSDRAFKAGGADELNEIEKKHSDAEGNRLLYVATTRARDHLVLSLFHSGLPKNSYARRLIACDAREGATELKPAPERSARPAIPFEELRVDEPGIGVEEFAAAREALVARARLQRYTSATALAPGRDAKDATEDDTEPWSRGRGGTHLGRAVHAAVQSLPLEPDAASILAFARAQAVAEAIPERAAEVVQLVERALSSAAATRARAAKRALREVPFAVTEDGVTLEGFIDLVIESDDGIEIVDWKTDAVTERDVDERLREYELQAGLYVLGLERATGLRVTNVTYVFVRPGIERSPGQPEGLRDAALERLRS
jgi:ATP-dependent helicase/nuclease subunit A